jgi:hypothetical protein
MTTTIFFSSTINQVIYAQFPIIFLFYIYIHTYMATGPNSNIHVIFIALFAVIGIGFVIYSYFSSFLSDTFRIIGGFSLIMILICIALAVIKRMSEKINNFVSPIISISLWIFIIIPYV